jgi:hypothetical protein
MKAIPPPRGPALPVERAAPTRAHAVISVRDGPSAQVSHAPAVAVLKTSVGRTPSLTSVKALAAVSTLDNPTPRSLACTQAVAAPIVALATAPDEILNVDAGTSRAVGRRERALAPLLDTRVTSANAVAVFLAAVLLGKTSRRLAAPVTRRPRASDFRKCYLAPGWPPAVRSRTGSAPVASLSTANLPCWASVYPRQTNYVSMAV